MLDNSRLKGITLSDRQRIAWLRLIRSENIGPISFRDLVNRFGSAQNALDALPELQSKGGAAHHPHITSLDEAEREIDNISRFDAALIGIGEPHYPPELRHIDAPPPLVTVKGNVDSLTKPAIGMVGSRNASINGMKFAAQLSSELSLQGYAIASGLARGIDTAAHKGARFHGTMAMLAGGIDQPYPPENQALLTELYHHAGIGISEMPFGWQPKAVDFPRRNRLIAGASLGLIVVEAAMRSGSLITARLAGNFGRLVFAVPGSPLDPRAHGTNALIRDGATLITSAQDVIEAIAPLRQRPLALEQASNGDSDITLGSETGMEDFIETNVDQRQKIILSLSPTPSGIDDIIRFTELEAGVVQMALLELELAGRLNRHSGGRVSLRVLH